MTTVIEPYSGARIHSVSLIEAERVLWPEAVIEFAGDPERMCEMVPEDWPETCHEAGEHAADVEVLFSCGLVVGYCDSAFAGHVEGSKTFVCPDDHCGNPDIKIVAVERFR